MIRTAVLGTKSTVGQIFVEMLKDYRWFEIAAVSASEKCVGRIRKDSALCGVKFVVLGHDTIRETAGLATLNAEYLNIKKYI